MTVMDLRPLSLAELLDRAFTLYRRHLWLLVGIMAVPAVIGLAADTVVVREQPVELLREPRAPAGGGITTARYGAAQLSAEEIGLIEAFLRRRDELEGCGNCAAGRSPPASTRASRSRMPRTPRTTKTFSSGSSTSTAGDIDEACRGKG
jgi:hypothetical protein